jgi:hypothetical protein
MRLGLAEAAHLHHRHRKIERRKSHCLRRAGAAPERQCGFVVEPRRLALRSCDSAIPQVDLRPGLGDLVAIILEGIERPAAATHRLLGIGFERRRSEVNESVGEELLVAVLLG